MLMIFIKEKFIKKKKMKFIEIAKFSEVVVLEKLANVVEKFENVNKDKIPPLLKT